MSGDLKLENVALCQGTRLAAVQRNRAMSRMLDNTLARPLDSEDCLKGAHPRPRARYWRTGDFDEPIGSRCCDYQPRRNPWISHCGQFRGGLCLWPNGLG